MSRVRMTLSGALFAVAIASSIGLHADEGPSPYSAWSLGAFGQRIGSAGIVVAGAGSQAEIYIASSSQWAGNHDYWYAVRRVPGTNQYEQSFISEGFLKELRRLALFHTPVAERPLAIAVAFADGSIQLYDQITKKLLGTDIDPCGSHVGLVTMTTRDLDGDGWDEFVSLCQDGAVAVHGYTYPSWVLPGSSSLFSGDIIAGQMDNDPAMEIAVTDGRVIDAATHLVQWTWPAKFGAHLQAADIDGDGRDELIGAEAWSTVFAYDVERQLPKWSIPTPLDIGAILLDDIDNDGVLELLLGDGQWGKVHAYSTATQLEEWFITNPEHGVTNIAVGDVNNDGVKEVLWGAGATSSGNDRLYVGNWVSRTISWENIQLDGPFLGPEVGDLDGDGIPEVVFASTESNAGYASGRIVVVDSRTMKVRAVSQGIAGGTNGWTGVHDLKLRDVNKDGRPEILIASDWLYDGVIEAYAFSAQNQFTLTWTNATRPYGQPFYGVEVADIDGDGTIEILGSGGPAHTGSIGEFVYVYDAVTHGEKFHTLQIGPRYSKLTGLVVAQLDTDPALEFAALIDGGGVYIFDGVTRALDAIIDVKAKSTSSIGPAFGIPGLLIGTTTGHVGIWTFKEGTYSETGGRDFGTRPIDGVQLTPDGALAVGSEGGIHVLREGALYHSGYYGTGFGRAISSTGGGRVLFSGGEFGVHALIVHP